MKINDEVSQCCQPQAKLFNRYNQKSYTDQPIELPFDLNANLNQSMYCQSSATDDNVDLLSQISSQLSEQSAAKGSQYSAFSRMNSASGMQQNGMDNIDMLKY